MKALILSLLMMSVGAAAIAERAPITPISNNPYTGAIVVDVSTGKTLFEDGADTCVYPASVVKLMGLLLIVERIEQGELSLTSKVGVTAEAARMGGSQVYLKEGEVFTLDEMLYALSIKSANDVAVALAMHVAGSKAAFVALMNRRAEALGMKATEFASVHGLPPETGQKPDVTTPRNVARLALEIVKHSKLIEYTSTREKWFRNNTFQMLSHNHLLGDVAGCDGLKTGYYRAAGFSIAATAVRDGRRIIAVVMGCSNRQGRDAKARELIEVGFASLPALPVEQPEVRVASDEAIGEQPTSTRDGERIAPRMQPPSETVESGLASFLKGVQRTILVLLAVVLAASALILVLYAINRHRDRWKYKL